MIDKKELKGHEIRWLHTSGSRPKKYIVAVRPEEGLIGGGLYYIKKENKKKKSGCFFCVWRIP